MKNKNFYETSKRKFVYKAAERRAKSERRREKRLRLCASARKNRAPDGVRRILDSADVYMISFYDSLICSIEKAEI